MTVTDVTGAKAASAKDPREQLIAWANAQDGWIRKLVAEVFAIQQPLGQDESGELYKLFLSEKGLNGAKPAAVPKLVYAAGSATPTEQLRLERVSDIAGVNALSGGAVIEFCDGLTILFGENATGKTGYARVLKRLAAVRAPEDILPNINTTKMVTPEAKVAYRMGKGPSQEVVWHNEAGVSPFTQMSIFDSPSVNVHVDDNLPYVYIPAELALFSHVASGVSAVQDAAAAEAKGLKSTTNPFARSFDRDWPIYTEIEALGATTDLNELAKHAELPDGADKERARLETEVASLRANTLRDRLTGHKEAVRALESIEELTTALRSFDRERYNEAVALLESVREAYRKVRDESFAKGELAGPADDEWETFIRAGASYRTHVGHEQADRCIYCRQQLSKAAQTLLAKYEAFLDDALSKQVSEAERSVLSAAAAIAGLKTEPIADEVGRQRQRGGDDDSLYQAAEELVAAVATAREVLVVGKRLEGPWIEEKAQQVQSELPAALKAHRDQVKKLTGDLTDRQTALRKSEAELAELKSRIELASHLPEIRGYVGRAKRAQRLSQLAAGLAPTLRGLTEVSKLASAQFINQDFQKRFEDECRALRAPKVRLEFVGREGMAQRRKTLASKHALSRILSEGEQKVLALADFLAEAQLGGSKAPLVFDDPISSLDYRRVKEVASRIVELVQTRQVIVFTHDIWLTTELLDRVPEKDCVYYAVTDDETSGAKGRVDRATGPRWDTVKDIGKRIDELLAETKKQSGEVQTALAERAYGLMRSWCEVFVEQVVFGGVTQRYRANVMMGSLTKVKPDRMTAAIATANEVFETACRNMPDHSQPLPRLAKRATFAEAISDWKKCQDALKAYNAP